MQLIKPKFSVKILSDAEQFILSLDKKVQQKITYNIAKATYVIDNTLFKKLEGSDIWEFRTLYAGNCYRLLAFWDIDAKSLVVATHGFVKKTDKTPKNEIERAESIRTQYFNSKKN